MRSYAHRVSVLSALSIAFPIAVFAAPKPSPSSTDDFALPITNLTVEPFTQCVKDLRWKPLYPGPTTEELVHECEHAVWQMIDNIKDYGPDVRIPILPPFLSSNLPTDHPPARRVHLPPAQLLRLLPLRQPNRRQTIPATNAAHRLQRLHGGDHNDEVLGK